MYIYLIALTLKLWSYKASYLINASVFTTPSCLLASGDTLFSHGPLLSLNEYSTPCWPLLGLTCHCNTLFSPWAQLCPCLSSSVCLSYGWEQAEMAVKLACSPLQAAALGMSLSALIYKRPISFCFGEEIFALQRYGCSFSLKWQALSSQPCSHACFKMLPALQPSCFSFFNFMFFWMSITGN